MNNTEYVYAVACVRVKETELISQSFTEQLINAASFDEMRQILIDKGFSGFEMTTDASVALSSYMNDTWNYLEEIAPDKKKLEFLIVKNDFHNLKAIIKGITVGTDGRGFCMKPCIIDIDEMYDAVTSKNFDLLPKWIADSAKNGYGLLTSTMDGRLLDMFLDKKSMECMLEFAKEDDFSKRLANETAALTDIKIAFRLAAVNADETLYEYAFCECEGIDTEELKKAAMRGTGQLVTYLSGTQYAFLTESEVAAAVIERRCDNYITEMLDEAKRISFGIEPLIAYYCAREGEAKNIRIIASAKYADMPQSVIRERMRDMYV